MACPNRCTAGVWVTYCTEKCPSNINSNTRRRVMVCPSENCSVNGACDCW